jgi:hypothetical protein
VICPFPPGISTDIVTRVVATALSEVLGQQFVAFGIHPDTKLPYYWHGGSPGEVKREDLPYVRAGDVRAFLDAAAKLLVAEFDFKDLSEPSAVSVGAATWSELAASDVVEGARNNTIARSPASAAPLRRSARHARTPTRLERNPLQATSNARKSFVRSIRSPAKSCVGDRSDDRRSNGQYRQTR